MVLLEGGEGVILKDLRKSYGAKGAWYKAKRVSTLDVVMTQFDEGYNEPVGVAHMAVFHGGELRPVGRVGLCQGAVRAAIAADPAAYLGTVCEVKALKLVEHLREPRFIRLRPDMDSVDVTWEKLQRDLMKVQLV